MKFSDSLINISFISKYMNGTLHQNSSVCPDAPSVLHRGLPAGITACLTWKCIQASAEVHGLIPNIWYNV